ncbi:MAG: hypothetical protein ACJAYB_001209 [Psychromonas sp.]|jgi:uncharacterized protein YccT (UPF0319 family)
MKKLLLFILLLPGLAGAYTLETVQGINVYTVNDEKVSSGPYQLIKGQNQIAVRFDGKLREQGQKEHFQSKPYLLTFTAKADLQLIMVSDRYKAVVAAEQQGLPIFRAKSDAKHIEQILLPAQSKGMPYADIAGLVSHYNEKNGLYFADGHLQKLSTTQVSKQKTAEQSKVVAQLKYWYSKATAEELAAFEKWEKAQ